MKFGRVGSPEAVELWSAGLRGRDVFDDGVARERDEFVMAHRSPRRADNGRGLRQLAVEIAMKQRRQQLAAWKSSQPQQPALFELKDDCRPAAERRWPMPWSCRVKSFARHGGRARSGCACPSCCGGCAGCRATSASA